MGQVCLKYNISKGRMYHYFTSKDDLFLACAKEFFQKMEDWLNERFPDCSKLSPAQKLQAYIMCYSDCFQQCFEDIGIYTTFAVCPPKHLEKDIMKMYRSLVERTHIILKKSKK